MLIHKGKKYTITADGLTAVKTDSATSRSMQYYPERDISAIAGEIDELAAWRIFRDIAFTAEGAQTPISPDHILIDGQGFVLAEWSRSHDERFCAPEGYSAVWALAATVFTTYLGCHVFQGLGGKGQTASTPIPVLRKELPHLSQLITQCLDFDPARRPSLIEIAKISEENLSRCEGARRDFPPLKKTDTPTVTPDELDSFWPEEMY